MSIVVVDASIVIDCFMIKECADALLQLTTSHNLAAPEHMFSEALSTLRRIERSGAIYSVFAENCVTALVNSAIESYPLRPLLQECWLIRHNITPYDAPYVVLAGELNCPLLTHDRRLEKAAREHVQVQRLIG